MGKLGEAIAIITHDRFVRKDIQLSHNATLYAKLMQHKYNGLVGLCINGVYGGLFFAQEVAWEAVQGSLNKSLNPFQAIERLLTKYRDNVWYCK